ncbi:hypothetical protein [Granulicella tundricola]|uniref:Uncharacterized protein n=1 Tax=Granulicella tundricola (strain ATCC BAA-1859 / DSM 23138 / MP5ACTX9) TaxID=1198114 RepID=E8X356_GRATM|nr:hypothetical protein [Granulicella tundricola]ADW69280.1 hypothetical protein AciX9_2239 [Granulicella tundricola MP5ACTX9]
MIQIPLTPEAFAAKSQELAEKHNITLTGHEGTLSKSGVTAGYKYEVGLLTVNILEKPFFVSTDYCETELKKFLA